MVFHASSDLNHEVLFYTHVFLEGTFSQIGLVLQQDLKVPQPAIDWIKRNVCSNYSISDVLKYLEKTRELKVTILGESILDKFSITEPLGKTSKDPLLAFNVIGSEVFPGGVLALANHASVFADKHSVQVLTLGPLYSRQYQDDFVTLKSKLNSNVVIKSIDELTKPIIKHRFVYKHSNVKIFEVYDFDENFKFLDKHGNFEKLVQENYNSDVVLVCDYGHGMLNKITIPIISKFIGQICVNTQANAGNRGFNTLTKYPLANLFTANLGELQQELRTSELDIESVFPELMDKLNASCAILTRGAAGLTIFREGRYLECPSFTLNVVDRTGAGDSIFLIASLLNHVSCPIEIIAFVSSLVAANEVSRLGNQAPIPFSGLQSLIYNVLFEVQNS